MNRSVYAPVAALVGLASCIGPSTEQRQQLDAEAKRAMRAFADHAIAVVPSLDDKISDARTIALAVTNACAEEYNAYTQATLKSTMRTGTGQRYYLALMNSAEEKINWGLPVVLRYRNGTLRKPSPTPN